MLWALFCSDFNIIWRISSKLNVLSHSIIHTVQQHMSECLNDQLDHSISVCILSCLYFVTFITWVKNQEAMNLGPIS